MVDDWTFQRPFENRPISAQGSTECRKSGGQSGEFAKASPLRGLGVFRGDLTYSRNPAELRAGAVRA